MSTKMCGAVTLGSARSLFEQRLALLGAEPLEPAAVADADGLHEAARLDLAQTGQGFENGDHLHLSDGLVGVRLLEEVCQRQVAHLELVLDLGPLTANPGSLFECSCALLWSECGRLRHGETIAPQPGPFIPICPLQPSAAANSSFSVRALRPRSAGSGPWFRSPRELLGSTVPGRQPAKRAAMSAGPAPWAPSPGARITPPSWDNAKADGSNVAPTTAPTVPVGMAGEPLSSAISPRSMSSTAGPVAVMACW